MRRSSGRCVSSKGLDPTPSSWKSRDAPECRTPQNSTTWVPAQKHRKTVCLRSRVGEGTLDVAMVVGEGRREVGARGD